jgi:UDP-N-acetylmuramoyl-L-alanyl-D-glutamate--2,6-diaminopimelate ligase
MKFTVSTIIKFLKNIQQVVQSHERTILNIAFDSRKVEKESLFVAVKGTVSDGHEFIDIAIESGAKTIVCEVLPKQIQNDICYIVVDDASIALGDLATAFYNDPTSKLELIGITGTNGKTTTVTLLFELFRKLGYKVGLISTIHYKINETVLPSTHTTPDPLQLNDLLQKMVLEGCSYVFMEVSSHAIDQQRIRGLKFKVAIFSNITHDHLDYHLTFDKYIKAKKQFFDHLEKDAFALVNIDDPNGKVMVQNTKATIKTLGLKRNGDFKVKILENTLAGLHLSINHKEVYVKLIGQFNAYNITTAYATAIILGQNENEVLVAISDLENAEGRFDYIRASNIVGIVDYAHTPDALQKVLETIQQVKSNGKVITVVGCGGDRDKTKRPIMAKIACDFSDKIILTSDNPRTEDAEMIIKEMEIGITIIKKKDTLSITDRAQAINAAVQLSTHGDIILIAGKGHEKYQDINGIKHPFDDKQKLKELLAIK